MSKLADSSRFQHPITQELLHSEASMDRRLFLGEMTTKAEQKTSGEALNGYLSSVPTTTLLRSASDIIRSCSSSTPEDKVIQSRNSFLVAGALSSPSMEKLITAKDPIPKIGVQLHKSIVHQAYQ